jgi:hypothetical protein
VLRCDKSDWAMGCSAAAKAHWQLVQEAGVAGCPNSPAGSQAQEPETCTWAPSLVKPSKSTPGYISSSCAATVTDSCRSAA